jgi:DNA-binding beta-propeller fold protein YncE
MRIALALALAAGCSADAIEVQPRSFIQPGDFAFACFGATAPLPLARCVEGAPSDVELHALIVQQARGEVASVDLEHNRVEDTDIRIPGFTFVLAGELPTAIAVPRGSDASPPRYAYVANYGSLDLDAIPLGRFKPDVGDTREPMNVDLSMFGAPEDVVLSPDETSLFVAIPEDGSILRIPVAGDGLLDAAMIERIPLGTTIPTAPTAMAPPAPYCQACAREFPSVAETCMLGIASPWPEGGTLPPRTPLMRGPTPEPVGLTLDAESNVVLVADAALPIVHRYDLTTAALLEPIPVGVPTDALAVTPAVAPTVGATPSVRYLYAIDATDRSVLVAEYPTGAVQAVNPAIDGQRDRLNLTAPAIALEIGTPERGAAVDPEAEVGATIMRGVFLFVLTTEGAVNVVDVEDQDAIRRSDAMCMLTGTRVPDYFIQRHSPRLDVTRNDTGGIIGSPLARRDGRASAVAENGETDVGLRLGSVACSAPYETVYPPEGPSLLCAFADPWVRVAEDWTATYEGTIPASNGGRGNFDGAVFTGEARFCARGVLGRGNAPVLDGAPFEGDLLVILGPLPTSASADCQATFVGANGEFREVVIPIVRAFEDRLELGTPRPIRIDAATTRDVSLATVGACFPELVNYEVRTGGRYAVIGSTTGFLHRVIGDPLLPPPMPGEPGRSCVLDATQPAARTGRAVHGAEFANGRVRFLITGEAPAPGDETVLSFSLRNPNVRLLADVSGIDSGVAAPGAVQWNPNDGRLYVVDTGNRGLIQYGLAPFVELRNFE